MADTSHVKTINIVSFIIIAFGFFIMMLMLSGIAESGGLGLSALLFFNTGLNMEITLLIIPALVMLLLSSKSIKAETSIGITRIVSLLSSLIIVIYLVFVCLGMVAAELNDPSPSPGVVDVMSLFMFFFAIEAALHFIVFLLANKSIPRGN